MQSYSTEHIRSLTPNIKSLAGTFKQEGVSFIDLSDKAEIIIII